MLKVARHQRAAQQIIGREGETATFIWRCPLNFSLREFGFAPRQFNRSMPRGKIQFCIWLTRIKGFHSSQYATESAKLNSSRIS